MAAEPARLEWSARAQAQLLEITRYYLEHASAQAARRVLEQIRAKSEELARFPTSGSPIEGLPSGFRRSRAAAYVILYRFDSTSGTVRILALRHVRQRPLSRGDVEALDVREAT